MNHSSISRAAESYYDRLQADNEAAAEAKEKATEMIEAAFENQTPVPFVRSTFTSAKLQYESFDDAVMGLIDYDEVKAALMALLNSNSPEVKKFISVCAARHVSMWADEVGGVL